jgi:RHS repeat-associated protein
VVKHPSGFTLGTVADPDSDYVVSYGYDTAGRLKTVTSPHGGNEYAYMLNRPHLLATHTSPVHVATRTYDPGRTNVAKIENKVGATLVSGYTYTLNNANQRVERAQAGSAFAASSVDVFGYNAKGELVESANTVNAAHDRSFVYDDIGNRKTATVDVVETGYTANLLNQYSRIDYSLPATHYSLPSYDLDGNQTATGTGQVYKWDGENRLIEVSPASPTAGDKKVVNTYDGQSRRVRREVYTYVSGNWSSTPTSDEKFIYDGWNVVAVLGWNASTSTFDLTKTQTWGLDLSGTMQGAGGVGGLLSGYDGGSVYHYTYDANGNVSEVLDSTGAIAAHYEYDAFGNTVTFSGSYAGANEYRFSTKPLDAVIGLYYYGLRYYNPSTGRWLSKDPIGERDGMNLYGMVRNDPIDGWDYIGLWTQTKWSQRPWSPNPRVSGSIGDLFAVNAQHAWALQERRGLQLMSRPAFKLLTHYLAGDGSEQTVDIGEIIRDEAPLRARFVNDLLLGFEFAGKMKTSGHISSTFEGPHRGVKWHLALGRSSAYQGDAFVSVAGNCITMTFRYHIWDPWDFEYTDDRAGAFLTDRSMRRMHDFGFAKEFLVSAKTKILTVKWAPKGPLPDPYKYIDRLSQ